MKYIDYILNISCKLNIDIISHVYETEILLNSNLVDTSPRQVCSAGRKGVVSISFMTHINPGREAVLPPLVCSVIYFSVFTVRACMCLSACVCARACVCVCLSV